MKCFNHSGDSISANKWWRRHNLSQFLVHIFMKISFLVNISSRKCKTKDSNIWYIKLNIYYFIYIILKMHQHWTKTMKTVWKPELPKYHHNIHVLVNCCKKSIFTIWLTYSELQHNLSSSSVVHLSFTVCIQLNAACYWLLDYLKLFSRCLKKIVHCLCLYFFCITSLSTVF